MIKPVNTTSLNTSKTLEYKCEKCGVMGFFNLKNSIIDVDKEASFDDYECPKCGEKLLDK